MQLNCLHGTPYDGCQAELIRVTWADGTLVATSDEPDADLVPGLLALCGVLAASQLGAERVLAMSRHPQRQQLAREFGATHVLAERGDEGAARVRDLTPEGVGADAVLECVGTGESVTQALRSARPGAMVGWVGAPHDVELPPADSFWRNVGVRGGPAPVRQYLPDLMDRVWTRRIDPGKVFDLELPLDQVGEAYRAMDERRAIKTLLRP
jgi:threonine dehydrogenase-like Zn-dependent dehydrogenase